MPVVMAKKTYKISEIKLPEYQAQKVYNGLLSIFKIKFYKVTAEVSDTNYTYWMYTDQKVNKAMLNNMENFIKGIVYVYKSSSQII